MLSMKSRGMVCGACSNWRASNQIAHIRPHSFGVCLPTLLPLPILGPQTRHSLLAQQVRASSSEDRSGDSQSRPSNSGAKQAGQQPIASQPSAPSAQAHEEPDVPPGQQQQQLSADEQAQQAYAGNVKEQQLPGSRDEGSGIMIEGAREIEDEAPSSGTGGQAGPAPQQASSQQKQQQEQPAAGSPWKELTAALAALAAFCRSVGHGLLALLSKLPLWVQQQQLKRLREACEEDPKSPEKHASLLRELNKVSPREVIARVESKQVRMRQALNAILFIVFFCFGEEPSSLLLCMVRL